MYHICICMFHIFICIININHICMYMIYSAVIYVLQIITVIIESYVAFYVSRLFCTDSVKIYTEYLKILKNIHRSAVTFNTKNIP